MDTFRTKQIAKVIDELPKSIPVFIQVRGQQDKIYPVGTLSADKKIFVITIYADEAIDREKFKLFPYPEK